MADPVLSVRDLRVRIGRREIVRGVSFDVHARADAGHRRRIRLRQVDDRARRDRPARRTGRGRHRKQHAGRAQPRHTELVGASPRLLREVHGGRIGFVFQDPGTSLNPLLTLERQITESLEAHRKMTRRQANSRALELLEAVGLPDPQTRLHSYPHQLSGGQRQRVMIAIALACDPELLIADEPTTSLDVTTQAQIIELVRELQRDFGTAVVWISHDLGVIGQVADDVTVLQDGETVEQAPILDVFDKPQHAYTRELLKARPLVGRSARTRAARGAGAAAGRRPRRPVPGDHAGRQVDRACGEGLSFEIRRGTTLGLVGESGSGKSTVAAALTGLVEPDAGTAQLDGADVFGVRGAAEKALRRRIRLVFQDPFSSLNPRIRVQTAIDEPLRVHRLAKGKRARQARVAELLELVGLPASFASRYPHELSGGQRQRVSIARALAAEPELLILDESTASLDVSVQARVLDLLAELQRELGLTYLFIGHDLAVIQQMSHDVLVMRDGEAVEYRAAAELFAAPEQDYTRALLAAVPPARPRAAV